MSTALLDIAPVATIGDDLLDLDLQIGVEAVSSTPAITSVSLCTPGCTSPGGGSNCSFCC